MKCRNEDAMKRQNEKKRQNKITPPGYEIDNTRPAQKDKAIKSALWERKALLRSCPFNSKNYPSLKF